MKRFLRFLVAPPAWLFYWLGGFIPRKGNRWIFGSYRNTFNDNSKYLYIHLVDNYPEIEAIWITSNPQVCNKIRSSGGRSYMRWSVKGIYFCLTGKNWFYNCYINDINIFFSRNAVKINLWHGIPLKKIEFDIRSGPLANKFQNPGFFTKWVTSPAPFRAADYILSTSEQVTHTSFASAFKTDPKNCLALGYPRNDVFFKSEEERTSIVNRWDPSETKVLIDKIKNFEHCFIYMPTWRDSNPDFLEESGWNFASLNASLSKEGILLLLKLHVMTPMSTLKKAENLSHIHIMQATEDVYNILPITSALITDYSSILFDYLLLDKPIIYYPFDREEYEVKSRGLYYDYDECVVGPCIQSPEDIIDCRIWQDSPEYKDARHALRERLFDHSDSLSSERITQKFL